MPANEIDGNNVWDLISEKNSAKNLHEYYALSTSRNFEGVMSGDGKWKLHLPHSYRSLLFPGKDGQPGKYETKEIELSLFDMENDPYESKNVIMDYPEVANNLMHFAELHKQKFYQK